MFSIEKTKKSKSRQRGVGLYLLLVVIQIPVGNLFFSWILHEWDQKWTIILKLKSLKKYFWDNSWIEIELGKIFKFQTDQN